METISRIQRVSEDSTLKHTGGIGRIVRTFIARRPRTALIIFLVLVGLVVLAYTKFDGASPEEKAQKELAAAVAAVGDLMILPEGDEPVLANVTDAETLIKQQAFFTGAIDGDQLLLFPKNMKAVIYSPSRNKIINAGPIEQSPQATAPQTNAEQVRSVSQSAPITSPSATLLRVAFYNGTKTVGLANEMESKLKSVSLDFETVAKTNAKSKEYKETIVIDVIGGTKSAEAQNIALALGAKVGELPSGETIPDADILVIAGGQ